MFEDLLPYTRVSTEEAVALMQEVIEDQNGCPPDPPSGRRHLGATNQAARHVYPAQRNSREERRRLRLRSDCRGRKATVSQGLLPAASLIRARHQKRESRNRPKDKAPWWNLAQVANQAKGNQIGSITDLKTSCYAAGFSDEAYLLVDELQHALDSLKHGTEGQPGAACRKSARRVRPAAWLQLKDKERVTDMPVHLEVLPTDKIGYLYNVCSERGGGLTFPRSCRSATFMGLINGEHFSREMTQECRLVNRIYAGEVGKLITEQQAIHTALGIAEAEYEGQTNTIPKRGTKHARSAMQPAVRSTPRKSDRARSFKPCGRSFEPGETEKTQNRGGWCQALLHAVVCAGKGNGSLLFHAFPQEVIDKVCGADLAATPGRSICSQSRRWRSRVRRGWPCLSR